VNQRIRCQTRGAVTDPVRRRGGASLNINDDDLAVGRDQYRHRSPPYESLSRLEFTFRGGIERGSEIVVAHMRVSCWRCIIRPVA
jgi:hypothetical protein